MPRSRREPRPRDAQATRRTLLDAAAAVFAEHGFAGARVDEIAARAGVNKRMIYAYYVDKEGLYRAVLASRLAGPGAADALADVDDPREALEEVVRWYFRLLRDDRAFARLLAWDMLSGGPGDVLVDSALPTLDRVSDLVRRGLEAGVLREGLDPEMFRAAIVALCLGYFLQHPVMEKAQERSGCRFSDEAFLDHACRLLFQESGGGGARGRRGRAAPPKRRRRAGRS